MNKNINYAIKAVITSGTMLAVNDFVGFYAPNRTSQTMHRLLINIAGCSAGFVIGKYVADGVIEAIDAAIDTYKKETSINV